MYFDLRVIVSYPVVMDQLTDLMLTFIQEKEIQCDQLCGVPYTGRQKIITRSLHVSTIYHISALPLATLLSVKMNKPMLIRRKEAKGYGTKKLIEGKFQAHESCLIIEDVVTTGSSVLETTTDLCSEGLIIKDAIVVVDREQGGAENIRKSKIKMHSLFTLSYLLDTLKDAGEIDEVKSVSAYIAASQNKSDKAPSASLRLSMNFAERAELAKSEVARALLKIMDLKKTTLCLAADLTKAEDILNLAESVGPFICLLKTHVDIIEDFSESFIKSLQASAEKHNFLILEDRKFADIGNTVSLQYSKGVYGISRWADLVTAHSLPGNGILKGLKDVVSDSPARGVFLLAEMSSDGNLISAEYKDKTIKMIEGHRDFVAGVVAQSADLVQDPGLIQLTPGVKIEQGGDNLGQQYNTPENVVKKKGADVAVVGRGIIGSKNPAETARIYRDQLWAAYLARIE